MTRTLFALALLIHSMLPAAEDFILEDGCAAVVIDINSAILQVLEKNRDILEVRDSVTRARIGKENEEACFAWKVEPNGALGYTNYDKHHDSDFSYGIGFTLSKKFQYGQRLYLSPDVNKKGKGFQGNASVLFVQPLLRGFGEKYAMARLCAAEYAVRSAWRQSFTRQVAIVQTTLHALFNVVKQEETVELNRESVDRLRKFYLVSKAKERIGLQKGLDLSRAKFEMKSAEEKLAQSEEQLRDAEERVKELLALPPETTISVQVPLDIPDQPIALQEAIDLSLNNRVEMDQALDAYRESKRVTCVAKNNMLPELNLEVEFTNINSYDYLWGFHPTDHHNRWRAGFSTSKDLFSTAEKNQYTLSVIAQENARRIVDKTRDSIISEVKKAHFAVETSKKKLRLLQEQIGSAQCGLKLSQLKFERNLSDNFDVVQAEKDLRQVQVQLFSQRIDLIIQMIKLKAAVGLFAEKPRIAF